MAEFLLEVRTEEIPARLLESASRRLAASLFENLVTRGLPPEVVESHYTLRRLVVCLQGLVDREPDRQEEVLGPPVSVAFVDDGTPTKALLGFAQRCGVEVDQVERRQTPKGEYAAVIQQIAGQPMAEILAALAPKMIVDIEWPKSMRWGASLGPWVRPVKGIVALLDGEVVPFELFGVNSGRETIAHPILLPQPITVHGWQDYSQALAEQGIEIRGARRREILAEGFATAAAELGGEVPTDDELLDRLAAVCEIPGVVVGSCDPEGIPAEVLQASLRDHQSAFSVQAQGKALPAFLTVMDRPDDPQGLVRQGNEWVVAARLEDARFFVAEDRKRGLNERRADLARLTFHRALGSYQDKTVRIASYGDFLCRSLNRGDLQPFLATAASLAKVDLTCEVVKEFTSLQGVIGGVYAREQDYPEEVAAAIYQQYQPASSEEPIPQGEVAQLLGIADRMVTLGGFFALGLIPSGSKDPFALRRAAQGAVEILIGSGLELDLRQLASEAIELHREQLKGDPAESMEALTAFLQDRVRSLLGRRGFAYDEVAAAVAVDDLPNAALARTTALHRARAGSGFVTVADAAKRIRNILSGQDTGSTVDEKHFQHSAEKDLWQAIRVDREVVEATIQRRDYEGALAHVAGYAPILERFFDQVLVMDPDSTIRNNRLGLLAQVDALFGQVGDLSQMAVDRRAIDTADS